MVSEGEASLYLGHSLYRQIIGRHKGGGSTETGTCKGKGDHIDNYSLLVGQTNRKVITILRILLSTLIRVLLLSSLAATIQLQRPELKDAMSSVGDAAAISEIPPTDFFAKHSKKIEDIGEPTNPCFFTNSQINPTDWYYIFLSPYFRDTILS